MLPLDRNYFRDGATLERSLDRLDASWKELSKHLQGDGVAGVKTREAAALTATSRWAYRSALARAESRGMQRRRDKPAADSAFDCLFEAGGLDTVSVHQRAIPWGAAAV
jgi:succinate dehydrogenase/fumarate reductase flavoprotein subunit